MDDLISRQAAIDAIHCDITITGRQNAELVAATIGAFADRIKALPSVQPEIIRRKDCKYHYKGICPIERYFSLDGFCGRAERRTE